MQKVPKEHQKRTQPKTNTQSKPRTRTNVPPAKTYVEDLELLHTTHNIRKVEMPPASPSVKQPQVTKIAQQQAINQHLKSDDIYFQLNHIATITPLHPLIQESELSQYDPMLHMINAIVDPNTGKPLEYRHLIWHQRTDIRETWK